MASNIDNTSMSSVFPLHHRISPLVPRQSELHCCGPSTPPRAAAQSPNPADEGVLEEQLLADAFSLVESHRHERIAETSASREEYVDNVYLRAMAVAYRLYGSLCDSPELPETTEMAQTPVASTLHRSLAALDSDGIINDSLLPTPRLVSVGEKRLGRSPKVEGLLTKGALRSIVSGAQHVP